MAPSDALGQEGDILVLYTDGVTETMNTDNHEFGRERLKTLIRQVESLPVKEVIQEIRQGLEEFFLNIEV